MSAIIFSGAAQVLASQLLAADAPFVVIVLMLLLGLYLGQASRTASHSATATGSIAAV